MSLFCGVQSLCFVDYRWTRARDSQIGAAKVWIRYALSERLRIDLTFGQQRAP